MLKTPFTTDHQITTHVFSKAKVFISFGRIPTNFINTLIVMNMSGKILYQTSNSFQPLYIDETPCEISREKQVSTSPYSFDSDEIFCIVERKKIIHIKDGEVIEYQYDDYVGTQIFKLDNIITWTTSTDIIYNSLTSVQSQTFTIYFDWKKKCGFEVKNSIGKLISIVKVYDNLYMISLAKCGNNWQREIFYIIIDIATNQIINEFPHQYQYIIDEHGATFIDIANKNIITYGKKEPKPGKDCVICFTDLTKTAKYCITSCGHSSFCECINSLQDKKCPICRKNIDNIIKLYD